MTDSIFGSLTFRVPQKAFENAIRKGMKCPHEYMYMYSTKMFDYFKHKDTRVYKRYFNMSRQLMTHKEFCELMNNL